MPLWFASLWGLSVFQKVCFAWADFLLSSRCLENWQCERSSFPSKAVIWKWTRNGHNFLHQDKTAVFGRQLAFSATPCYWRTSSVTHAETLCHPAPTLQIARKAGPNYDHTTGATQAHMIRWNLPELSNLRYSTKAILPNRPPMSRNHISSLATHPR